MSRIYTQLITALLIAAMLATLLFGCKNESGSHGETQDYYYTAQVIPLPDDIGDIDFSNITFNNERVYFSAQKFEFGDAEQTYGSFVNSIYSMSVDGTDIFQLSGYEAPETAPEGAFGSAYIRALSIDNDGNLWVAERWDFYSYDVPEDFDYENEDYTKYYVDYGRGSAIRKLDSTGAELLSADTEYISERQDFYIRSLAIDGEGNVYVSTGSHGETVETMMYVLDDSGRLMFGLSLGNMMGFGKEFICMPDGTMAYSGRLRDSETGYYTSILQKIDISAKALGDAIDYPNAYGEVQPGSGGYDIIINGFETLYGYTLGEKDAVKILNWIDSNISNDGISNIYILSDGRIVCTRFILDIEAGKTSNELLLLTKTPIPDNSNKTILNFAAFSLSSDVRNAVAEFNRTNAEYFIQVTDYAEYSTEDDWSAGLKRLSTEIISGNVPDILELSNLPYREYVAKGLLTDIHPLIDSDPDFERSDILESILRASEIDRGLYQVFPSFFIDTIIGHPSIVGTDMGWDIDEYSVLLGTYPDADAPLGEWMTKSRFLAIAALYTIDDYIDWDNGTTHFDSPEFIRLMELANNFPTDPDWNTGAGRIYATEEETLKENRQLMMRLQIRDFQTFAWGKAVFGGEIIIKGFPIANRNGNSLVTNISLGISESSEHKEAAWSFVRTILDKNWQLARNTKDFPTNREAFEYVTQNALDTDYENNPDIIFNPGAPGGEYGFRGIQVQNLTQDDINYIEAVIESASITVGFGYDEAIINIIIESVAGYFDGTSSAQDTARVIQSRVSILVSERS